MRRNKKETFETFNLNEYGDFYAIEVECEGESRKKGGRKNMKKSHEEMMQKAWATIESCGITEDKAQYEADSEMYLVDDIHKVRDALYSDMEQGHRDRGRGLRRLFCQARHQLQMSTPCFPVLDSGTGREDCKKKGGKAWTDGWL